MTSKVREALRNVKATVEIPDRQYKREANRLAQGLYDEIVGENERLERQISTIEDMLKILSNQSQLAISEVRQLRKSIDSATAKSKRLAAENSHTEEETTSEEVDLQGE